MKVNPRNTTRMLREECNIMRGSRSTAQHYVGERSLLYKESDITTSHSFVGYENRYCLL